MVTTQNDKKTLATNAALKTLFKLVISLGLLTWLMCLIDWQQAWQLVPNANIWLLLLSVVILTLERGVSVFKWLILLRTIDTSISFWRLFIISYVGGFWGMVLPSSVSADIVRGYYLARTSVGLGKTVISMVADRLLAGLALLVLACAGAWMAGDLLKISRLWTLVGTVIICAFVLLFFILFRPAVLQFFLRALAKVPIRWIKKIQAKLQDLTETSLVLRRYPLRLGSTLLLSILMQILRALVFYVVAEAFGVKVPLAWYFLFIPLITVLIMLPVSFNGLGIREGSFAAFFGLIGVSSAHAFTVSFTVSLITTLTTAVGGVIYMFDRGRGRG